MTPTGLQIVRHAYGDRRMVRYYDFLCGQSDPRRIHNLYFLLAGFQRNALTLFILGTNPSIRSLVSMAVANRTSSTPSALSSELRT